MRPAAGDLMLSGIGARLKMLDTAKGRRIACGRPRSRVEPVAELVALLRSACR